MFKYAQIDVDTRKCIGISYLSGEVEAENMILLLDSDNVSPNDLYDNATDTWTPAPQPQQSDPKQIKIKELNTQCNQTILSGFTSSALSSLSTYDFDYDAQINFSGMLNAITSGIITEEPVYWKASGSPQPHTFAQFKQVYADGLAFKNTQINKYWALKAQVESAETKEEIDAVAW